MQNEDGRLWLALLLLATSLPVFGADPEVKAGGVVLTLPAPAGDFAESGDKLRTTFFEPLVPSTNRLLDAYLPAQTLAAVNAGKAPGTLDMYAMVEVARRTEYAECTPQAFEQVVKGAEPSMGTFVQNQAGDLADELNIRLKSLGAKPLEIGRVEMLGGLFKKPDAFGFALLTAYKQGDRSVTMASGMAVLRVRQRLIFAYLFRKYESPDTISWLHRNLEAWADAILAKN